MRFEESSDKSDISSLESGDLDLHVLNHTLNIPGLENVLN